MFKRWGSLAVLLMAMTGYGGDATLSPGNEILGAYSEMQYVQACKLADKYPKLAESRLVKALCAVFDRRQQNLAFGLPELNKIYSDPGFKPNMRVEAGLAYARAAQTLQMRKGVYPLAENIDFNKIYDDIITKYPSNPAAVFAAIYQAQGWFDTLGESGSEKGFARLHGILKDFSGSKKFLGPVHYMLADRYIIHGNHYDLAVKQLEAAREIGISNPRNREDISFRIARIYDLYLHNRSAAELNYQHFLQEFPNSANAPIVKRYLAELKNGKKEVRNG